MAWPGGTDQISERAVTASTSAGVWILGLSTAWVVIGVASGFLVHRLSIASLNHDTWMTRLRAFECDGRFYERHLDIRRWKDRLPEAGATFRGGFSKRAVTGRSSHHLVRFAAETRRAEYVHWMNAAAGPAFLLFLPLWGGVLMTAFSLAVHMPFVVIQRYNRARLLRTLARRAARVEPTIDLTEPATTPV